MLSKRLRHLCLVCLCALPITACEQLGLETPAQTAALRDAEGRAMGGACRHAGRALEDCYVINPRASKASIYNGWRDMDAYMRENKLDVITPEFEPKNAPPKPGRAVEEEGDKKAAKEEEKAAEPAPEKEKPAEAAKGKNKGKRT